MLIVNKKTLKKILLNNMYFVYFIIGKEFLISDEIEKMILKDIQKKNYLYIRKVIIEKDTDWEKIFYEYQQIDLFNTKKIILLNIPSKILDNNIISNIKKLFTYINKNIILIIKFNKISAENNLINYFIKIFNKTNSILIPVQKLNRKEIKIWIKKKIKNMQFSLETQSIDTLSYYYENNLLILLQLLKTFQLIGIKNTLLKHTYIEDIIENSINFKIIHWIDALLCNNKIQALRILNYFQQRKKNILAIIRNVQQNLLFLIYLQKTQRYQHHVNDFKKHNLSIERCKELEKYMYKIEYIKLYQIINILTKIEIDVKTNKNTFIWIYLKKIIMIF